MGFSVWFGELGQDSYGPGIEVLRHVRGVKMAPLFVIPNFTFQMFLRQTRLDEHLPYLFESPASPEQKAAQMRQWLLGEPLPREIEIELTENIELLADDGKEPLVVVRPSEEDARSLVGVKGIKPAIIAIKEVWASVFSERYFANASHEKNQVPPLNMMVQKYVAARKTAKIDDSPGSARILVNFGLPQGVSDDNADVLTLIGQRISTTARNKRRCVFDDPLTSGFEEQELSPHEQQVDVLSEPEAIALVGGLEAIRKTLKESYSVWGIERGVWNLLGLKRVTHHEHRQAHERQPLLPPHHETLLLGYKKTWQAIIDDYKARHPQNQQMLDELRKDIEKSFSSKD